MREVEEYLRPILMERLKKDIHDTKAESVRVLVSLLCDWVYSWDRTIWLHGSGTVHPKLNALFKTLQLEWFFSTLQLFIRLPLWVPILAAWCQESSTYPSIQLLTHVLFNLAAYPSYTQPLRDEISSIIQAEGWDKLSIEKMRKLDSFIKESQRLYGTEAGQQFLPLLDASWCWCVSCLSATSVRLAMSDFTFSDGTIIPEGTTLSVAGRAINHDEARRHVLIDTLHWC
jgi:hypothetical protein